MIATTLHQISMRLAAKADDAATAVTTTGLSNWLKGNVVTILVLVIGLGLLMKSNKGDHSGVVLRVGLTVMALGVIAIGLDNTMGIGIGKWVVGLLGVKVA